MSEFDGTKIQKMSSNKSSNYRWSFDPSKPNNGLPQGAHTDIEYLDTNEYYKMGISGLREIFTPLYNIRDVDEIFLDRILKNGLDATALPTFDNEILQSLVSALHLSVDNYRFQGFTVTKNYIYLSAYSKKKDRSIMMVYDKNGEYSGIIYLPSDKINDAHVGGVSYDSEHDIIYITSKGGKVLAIDNKVLEASIEDARNDIPIDMDMLEIKEYLVSDNININSKEIKEFRKNHAQKIQNKALKPNENGNLIYYGYDYRTNQKEATSVYYDKYDQKIYIPVFSTSTEIYVFDVSFDSNNKPQYTFNTIYFNERKVEIINYNDRNNSYSVLDPNSSLPNGVQGIATFKDQKGEKYLLMVSSYGSRDSVITKYKINEDETLSFSGQKVFEDKYGLENIVIYNDGTIYGNIENNVNSPNEDSVKFVITNVDEINDSFDDPNYTKIMDEMGEIIDKKKYDK